MARRMDVCKKARRLVPLLTFHAQSQRRHRSKLFDPPAPQTPRPVVRFWLPAPVVMARASTDEKGFIMGLRHHLCECPRPDSHTNFSLTNQPAASPTNSVMRSVGPAPARVRDIRLKMFIQPITNHQSPTNQPTNQRVRRTRT